MDANQENANDPRSVRVEEYIQSLVHACQCHHASCQQHKCQKIKRVVTHTKICKRKTKSDCPICKQLIALCCYHAENCQETDCSVPFCVSIKQKIEQRRVREALNRCRI